MWVKEILLIQLEACLVAGQIPSCPNGTGGGGNPGVPGGSGGSGGPGMSHPVSSCDALNSGKCLDMRCKNCEYGEWRKGLCEHSKGKWAACCARCPRKTVCSIEAPGFFTTYYGKRFNFQKEGFYVLSEDCETNLWSINIILRNFTETEPHLEFAYINVGDVRVKVDFTNQEYSVKELDGFEEVGFLTPRIFGDVVLQEPFGLNLVKIDFYGVSAIAFLRGRSMFVVPGYAYRNKTCGLCGAISDEPSDFTTDLHQLSIKPHINVENEKCPFTGNPVSLKECKTALLGSTVHCTRAFSFQTYLQACALAHCQGGLNEAAEVLENARVKCKPLRRGTCTMSGHTFYDKFDRTSLRFQAIGRNSANPQCTLLLAADCEDNSFSVSVTHVDKPRDKDTEVEKVTAVVNGVDIELIAAGKQVKVFGEVVSPPLNDDEFSFASIFYENNGEIVTVAAPSGSFTVRYDFKQLVVVRVHPQFYNKTCGMCGVWNDDPSDDNKYSAPDECKEKPFGDKCRSDAAESDYRETCQKLFDPKIDDKCNICYESDRVDRCVHEACLSHICDHVKEFTNKCKLKKGEAPRNSDTCT